MYGITRELFPLRICVVYRITLSGMKSRNAISDHASSVRPNVSRLIFAVLPKKGLIDGQDVFSFCVDHVGSKNLHIAWLTESGATPPAALALLLLLALPLLLELQKAVTENALIKLVFSPPYSLFRQAIYCLLFSSLLTAFPRNLSFRYTVQILIH